LEKLDKLINTISNNIKLSGLPGAKGQSLMAPSIRNTSTFKTNKQEKEAAVLILLYEKNNILKTVFTKRHSYEGPHGGQISLPGGKREPVDKNLIETALRETEEELGIPNSQIIPIHSLTSLHIPVSNINVTPIVAYTKKRIEFIPDIREVNFIIECPLNLLKDEKIRKTEILRINNIEINAPYFDIDSNHIW